MRWLICLGKDAIHTTCVLDTDKYIDYVASWFDAWVNEDSAAMAKFKTNGALSKDGNWTDYASKNMSSSYLTASVFTKGSLMGIIAAAELLIIAALCVCLFKARKKA